MFLCEFEFIFVVLIFKIVIVFGPDVNVAARLVDVVPWVKHIKKCIPLVESDLIKRFPLLHWSNWVERSSNLKILTTETHTFLYEKSF